MDSILTMILLDTDPPASLERERWWAGFTERRNFGHGFGSAKRTDHTVKQRLLDTDSASQNTQIPQISSERI